MVKGLLVQGYFMTNCYLFIDDKTKHGFLIDPGAEPDKIINTINDNGFIIEKILLTHGHFDHTAEAERLSAVLNAPIYICMKMEESMLRMQYGIYLLSVVLMYY